MQRNKIGGTQEFSFKNTLKGTKFNRVILVAFIRILKIEYFVGLRVNVVVSGKGCL